MAKAKLKVDVRVDSEKERYYVDGKIEIERLSDSKYLDDLVKDFIQKCNGHPVLVQGSVLEDKFVLNLIPNGFEQREVDNGISGKEYRKLMDEKGCSISSNVNLVVDSDGAHLYTKKKN